jgi:cytidylate kinase
LAQQVQIDVRSPSQQDGRACDVLADGQDVTWDIRRPEVDANVSVVSAYRGVREAMTVQQRRVGMRGQVVMLGRDIGTVVLPEADLKIYLDASAEVRARRRYDELRSRGEPADLDAILASMLQRDRIDSTREVAPLRPATNAIILNSDNLSADQVLEQVKALIYKRQEAN